jgi:hypothetical protein
VVGVYTPFNYSTIYYTPVGVTLTPCACWAVIHRVSVGFSDIVYLDAGSFFTCHFVRSFVCLPCHKKNIATIDAGVNKKVQEKLKKKPPISRGLGGPISG